MTALRALLAKIPPEWRRRLLVGGGVALALVAAFLAGKYSAPTKVETRTEWKEIRSVETRWQTKIEYQDRTKIRTRIVTVERLLPSGERETTRTEESGTDVAVNSGSSSTGQSNETTASNAATATVKETARPGWAVGLGVEVDPRRASLDALRINADVARRLAGTVWIVAEASVNKDGSDPKVGAGVRLEF